MDLKCIKGLRKIAAIVSCLLQTSADRRKRTLLAKPADEVFDAGRAVGKGLGKRLLLRDEVTKEFGFADINTEKNLWDSGGFGGSLHSCYRFLMEFKTSRGGQSQSHQNRFESDLRCCSDLKAKRAT